MNNIYIIDYHREDLTKGHIYVKIEESGWWKAIDTIQTDPNLYIDKLVDFIRNELFNLQVMKGIQNG